MDWSCFKVFKKEEEKKSGALKVVLITLGAITAVAAAGAVVYTIFKKYFTITIECGDCENCDEDCLAEEDAEEEPVCEEAEAADAAAPEAETEPEA